VNKLKGNFDPQEINQVANRVLTCERPNKQIQDRWPWINLKEARARDLRKFYLPPDIVAEKPSFSHFVSYRQQALAKRLFQLIRNGE
jgi:hypothetical protein